MKGKSFQDDAGVRSGVTACGMMPQNSNLSLKNKVAGPDVPVKKRFCTRPSSVHCGELMNTSPSAKGYLEMVDWLCSPNSSSRTHRWWTMRSLIGGTMWLRHAVTIKLCMMYVFK
eukprot:g32066.t1